MNGHDQTRLRFSVIVVSHRRPKWLERCLRSLRQLDYPAFEIVIVADRHSLAGLDGDDFKRVEQDMPGISNARNAGIAVAAGEVCAFIDDDSVAEPLWLHHHERALKETGAVACVGYVRGRNGISFQSRIGSIDAEGETHAEPSPDGAPFVPDLKEGRALKLVGTNSVIFRDALVKLGGYDPAYGFYLDDTDLSLRLERAGMTAAVAPFAEVHHAFASSARRTGLRAPTDLFDIGRSMAIFLRRHRGLSEAELWQRLMAREKARMTRHMVRGTCEPRDVQHVLGSLKAGWTEGLKNNLPKIETLISNQKQSESFQTVTSRSGHEVLTSRLFGRRALVKKADAMARNGQRVSVFSFSLTPVRHIVRYSESGVWVQTGGQFGRADRNDRVFRWCRFAKRTRTEITRVANQRGI